MTALAMTASYDGPLVALSVVIAIVAAYAALDLVERITASQGRVRLIWLSGGAIAMGIGIWSMHFIGMLAYNLPIPTTYDLPLVVVSMAVAIFASAIALALISHPSLNYLLLLAGGISLGLGIAAMHYIGMAAMRMRAVVQYDASLASLSIAIAIGTSLLALWLTFQLRAKIRWMGTLRKIGAVIMGSAIAGMHYTGMAAARFNLSEQLVPLPAGVGHFGLAIAIGCTTLIILGLVLLASLFEQRLNAETKRAEALRQSEERFRSLVQNASDIIILLNADGTICYSSSSIQRILGYEAQQWQNKQIDDWVHLDDLTSVQKLLTETIAHPGTDSTVEIRLRHADQSWRDFEIVTNNLLNEPSVLGIVATCRDITEKKQTNQALRQALQQLTFHIDNSSMAVIEWGQDFRVSRWSREAEKVFGWSAEEVLGKHPSEWKFLFAEDVEAINQAIAALSDGRQQQNVSFNRNYRQDGSVIYCEWYNSALSDASGNLVSVLSCVLDVTARQQLEDALKQQAEELRKSRDQLEVILRGVADGIMVQSADGLVYANAAAARLIGYSSIDALLAAPLPEVMQNFEVMDEFGQPFPLTDLPGRMALQGQQSAEILRYRVISTGEERWSLVKATPILDQKGQVQFAINIFHDITERKRNEEAQHFLAEAGTLLSSSLDCQMILTNLARLVVPRLADWCTVDMLKADHTIQRLAVAHVDPAKVELAWELDRRYPTDPKSSIGVPKVLQTGQPELGIEVPDSLLVAATQDEEHLRVLRELGLKSYMIVPLIARGQTLGAITFVTAESSRRYDVSDLAFAEDLARRAALALTNSHLFEAVQQELAERKRAEDVLHQRAEDLSQTMRILAQTTAVLEKRNQELDQFAYVISHDLKAPLRAIANLSEWLEEDIEEQLTPETQHQMNLLRGRVHRMEALIDGLLQYSRVGRVETDLETVAIASLLDEVIDSLAPPPEFTIEIASEMPTLTTERLRLEQVFANLISNAVKYHSRSDGHVWITAHDQGDFYEFAVTDDGPGIDPQYHEKVFSIFQTLQSRDKIESTGIGLSLVKRIVEDKGGQVWLESQADQGATFRFTWHK